MNDILLRTIARPTAALMLLFSLFLLLRGHNEPGGGFIGGLIAAAGLIVLVMGAGTDALRRVLRIDPCRIAALGLAVALVAGLLAAFAGEEFLTGLWLFIGADETSKGLPLGTPLLFDVGVYLVVVGAVSAILLALEESLS